MRRTVFVLGVTLALALTACGGDETPSASTGGGGTTGSGGSDCVDLTSGDTFTVTISNFAYDPSCFTARAAQRMSLVNEDSASHTLTISGTDIDVEIGGGETLDLDPVTGIVQPGTYDFSCRFHPSMTGRVTIE